MEMLKIRPCPNCGGRNWRSKLKEPPFVVVKCPSCSLVYLGNPPEEEVGLYDYYHSAADPGSAEYQFNSSNRRLGELYAINEQRIARIKLLKPGSTLLDVGCGRGEFLKTAREHGYQACGIDASERAVSYARQEFGLSAEVRSLREMAVSGEQFDVVTLWHVLEHFTEPYEALRQIRHLLKGDGICAIEVPNLYSIKFVLSRAKWEGGNHPLYHRTFFTAATLRDGLRRVGFSRVHRVRWSYHVPGRSGLYELLKRSLNVVGLDAFLDFVAWK